MFGPKPFRTLLLSAVLLSGMVHMAAAQMMPFAGPAGGMAASASLFNPNGREPDIASVPVLLNIVKSGAKLYYMGERSSMPGWFIVKDGQVQMIYLSPDRQTVLLGGMFSAKGENVTSPQISAVVEKNPELKNQMTGQAEQQRDIYNAGAPDGVASVAAPAAGGEQKAIGALPAVSSSPGERLLQDLRAAAGVALGRQGAPEIMMVAAPGCPNCKRTWEEIRGAVKDGKAQVRLIPVYNSTGGEEGRVSARLLTAPDPLDAWDRYVGGDVSALAGEADEIALRGVVANLNLVSKWNIQGYPYLVYRAKDGRVKIVQGKPERMAAVLLDLLR